MAETLSFPGPVITILTILLGIVLLVSGRRLFWLTVAVVGFLAGLVLTVLLLEIQPEWLGWVIALAAGGVRGGGPGGVHRGDVGQIGA